MPAGKSVSECDETVIPSVFVGLCGELRVSVDGTRVDGALHGRQGPLLLAYLALNRERPVGRDELCDRFWDQDQTPARPGPALSVLLTRTRQAVGRDVIADLPRQALGLAAGAEVDVEQGLRAAARAQAEHERGEH